MIDRAGVAASRETVGDTAVRYLWVHGTVAIAELDGPVTRAL
jgi:hypothetical protein